MAVDEGGEWCSPATGRGSESVEQLACRAVVVIAIDLLGDALTQGHHKLDGVFSQKCTPLVLQAWRWAVNLR